MKQIQLGEYTLVIIQSRQTKLTGCQILGIFNEAVLAKQLPLRPERVGAANNKLFPDEETRAVINRVALAPFMPHWGEWPVHAHVVDIDDTRKATGVTNSELYPLGRRNREHQIAIAVVEVEREISKATKDTFGLHKGYSAPNPHKGKGGKIRRR